MQIDNVARKASKELKSDAEKLETFAKIQSRDHSLAGFALQTKNKLADAATKLDAAIKRHPDKKIAKQILAEAKHTNKNALIEHNFRLLHPFSPIDVYCCILVKHKT